MNRYYIHFPARSKTIGPYGFKKALIEKAWFESTLEQCEIVKIVVDIFGKEVK